VGVELVLGDVIIVVNKSMQLSPSIRFLCSMTSTIMILLLYELINNTKIMVSTIKI